MTRKQRRPQSILASLPQELRREITLNKSGQGSGGKEDDRLQTPSTEGERPAKRRKANGILSKSLENYDATGLVPFYRNPREVPECLKKYYAQRHRLFSRYEEGCLLDEEGWFSVTPELIADQIAERCRCDTIVDAFCGVGGNSIAFAKTCERVIAIDNSPVRLALARHNAAIYGVVDRIEFVLADFVSFAANLPTFSGRTIDVVFLSPPWGGINYQSLNTSNQRLNGNRASHGRSSLATTPQQANDSQDSVSSYSLDNLAPICGQDLFKLARRITPHVALFLPRNQDLDEVSTLVASGPSEEAAAEVIEVEEEWMGNKLKALTCYFGGLVHGQGHLWE